MATALWMAALGAVLSHARGAPGPAHIRLIAGDPATCPWRIALLDRGAGDGAREVCASGINISFEAASAPSGFTAEVTSSPITQNITTSSTETDHTVPEALVPLDYVQLASEHYYKVFTQKKTWSDAQTTCRNDNANLLVLDTLEEAIAVRTYLAVKYDYLITEQEPNYDMHAGHRAKLATMHGGVQQYERWAPSEPKARFCGVVDNYMWLSYGSCSKWLSFVCEYDPSQEGRAAYPQDAVRNFTTHNLQYFTDFDALPCCNGTYYRIMDVSDNDYDDNDWISHRLGCGGSGLHLPVIDTEKEAEDLTDLLLKAGTNQHFYLGIRTNDPITVHGHPVSISAYQRWKSTEIESSCFMADATLLFASVNCFEMLNNSVCEFNTFEP